MEMTVRLERMRVYARIGVAEQERVVGNEFDVTVGVTMEAPLTAVDGDCLDGTVSYADLACIVRQQMALECRLIENAAGRIMQAVVGRWAQLSACEVTVAKLTPPMGAQVGQAAVTLRWCRSE